ncbi:MAG: hypothetical protein EZS28_012704 [Streblomastix strix]|uniref:Uncharacterized protein n=1 Tax=Streblomastix strix TaxID=222440 RepID=A0A5J4WA01_9EUKA|nr:MAG: hypothetical protein EZS28_012704 [Streblomastix strix]
MAITTAQQDEFVDTQEQYFRTSNTSNRGATYFNNAVNEHTQNLADGKFSLNTNDGQQIGGQRFSNVCHKGTVLCCVQEGRPHSKIEEVLLKGDERAGRIGQLWRSGNSGIIGEQLRVGHVCDVTALQNLLRRSRNGNCNFRQSVPKTLALHHIPDFPPNYPIDLRYLHDDRPQDKHEEQEHQNMPNGKQMVGGCLWNEDQKQYDQIVEAMCGYEFGPSTRLGKYLDGPQDWECQPKR